MSIGPKVDLRKRLADMTHDNRIWVLMSRYLSGETSPEEGKELQDLLEQDPRKQYAYDILRPLFHRISGDRTPEASAACGLMIAGLEENLFQKIIATPAKLAGAHGPRTHGPRTRDPHPGSAPTPRRVLYLTPGKCGWRSPPLRSPGKPAAGLGHLSPA